MSASSGKSASMLSTKSYGALSVPQGGGSAFWRARSIGALVVIGAVVGWDRAISVPASTGQQTSDAAVLLRRPTGTPTNARLVGGFPTGRKRALETGLAS
jgi:hypothetical protein